MRVPERLLSACLHPPGRDMTGSQSLQTLTYRAAGIVSPATFLLHLLHSSPCPLCSSSTVLFAQMWQAGPSLCICHAFPLPEMLFSQTSVRLASSPPSGLHSKVTLSRTASSSTWSKFHPPRHFISASIPSFFSS